MNRRKRRSNPLLIIVLLALIGGMVYINEVVVPTTPPLFIPTPTATRSPESYIADAQSLVQQGKISQAIVAYQQANLVDPKNAAVYVALARLQVYSGNYEDAVINAENALLLNQNNALALALRGWAKGFLGDYLEAEASLQQAIQLDANNPVPYAYYAEMLILQQLEGRGDFNTLDKAIEYSNKAKTLGPNTLEAHRARGIILENTGNTAEAVTEYEAAIAINPYIADLHMALGRSYRALPEPDYARAIEQFNYAVPLDPTNPLPKTYLSRTYQMAGDYAKAIQYAEDAIRDSPSDPYLHGNLGILYRKNFQLPDAVRELRMAVRGGTTSDGIQVEGLPLDYGRIAEYYFSYGLALAETDDCGEALQIAQLLQQSVGADDIAMFNAQEMINICEILAGKVTATPAPTEAP